MELLNPFRSALVPSHDVPPAYTNSYLTFNQLWDITQGLNDEGNKREKQTSLSLVIEYIGVPFRFPHRCYSVNSESLKEVLKPVCRDSVEIYHRLLSAKTGLTPNYWR